LYRPKWKCIRLIPHEEFTPGKGKKKFKKKEIHPDFKMAAGRLCLNVSVRRRERCLWTEATLYRYLRIVHRYVT